MAYNTELADRLRLALNELGNFEEKAMFGGLAYMLNGKMCVGIIRDDLMCRIDPEIEKEALEKPGTRPMDFAKRPMKGYVYVDETGIRTDRELQDWVQLCIDFNPKAKASRKKSFN